MDVRNDFESIEQQANLLTDNIRYKARIKKKHVNYSSMNLI